MRRNREPRDARAPRPFYFDARFGVGLVLVVASVAGVVGLVSSADRSTEVWAARSALTPGDTVAADDLVLTSVRLGDAGDLYLDDLPEAGVVVTHAVAAGELVPASAVGDVRGIDLASVVVTVGGELPQSIRAGSTVDVWAAREIEGGVFGPPSVLVSQATVVRVLEADGLAVSGTTVDIEVLVPRDAIAAVLEALANDDAMSLVPVALPTVVG
jgi:hypothetical protein